MSGRTNTIDDWGGDFGDDYIERNLPDAERVAQREAMWKAILPAMAPEMPGSIVEIGANVGINLRALRNLTDSELFALEPNRKARGILRSDGVVPESNILTGTGSHIELGENAVDLAFTSGVLIHVPPEELPGVYKEMHRVSRRYLLSIEYFAAEPEGKRYRGRDGLLFKRDFGALWLDLFPDLKIVDYGFFWRPATGLDNLTWWLFRKP